MVQFPGALGVGVGVLVGLMKTVGSGVWVGVGVAVGNGRSTIGK